jgi:hypothetical protein
VIGFNPRTNTVLAVNDQYFPEHAVTLNCGLGNHTTSSTSSRTQQTASGSGTTPTTSSSSSPEAPRGASDNSPPPPDPRQPSPPNPGVPVPETPPDTSVTSQIGTFRGVFTVENPCGHPHSAAMMFCLQIVSTSTRGMVFTTTVLTDLCLSLYSPGDPQQSTSKDPLSPYFVCNELRLRIGPDSPQINKFDPFSKVPNRRWDVLKASQSSEHTVGLTPTLAFPPSIQLGVSKKSVGGLDLDPISRYIDFEHARFRQLWSTREHFWKYPLRCDRPRDDDIELAPHTLKVRYRDNDNIESIHAHVTVDRYVRSRSQFTNRE